MYRLNIESLELQLEKAVSSSDLALLLCGQTDSGPEKFELLWIFRTFCLELPVLSSECSVLKERGWMTRLEMPVSYPGCSAVIAHLEIR